MGMERSNVFKVIRRSPLNFTLSANVYWQLLRLYLDAEHRNKKKKPFDFMGWEDYTLEARSSELCCLVPRTDVLTGYPAAGEWMGLWRVYLPIPGGPLEGRRIVQLHPDRHGISAATYDLGNRQRETAGRFIASLICLDDLCVAYN